MPSRIDLTKLEIHLSICKPMDNGWVHWMIILRHPGDHKCTYLHSTGAPFHRSLSIEDEKRFDSWSIDQNKYITTIPVCRGARVVKEAKKVPLQSCQLWACYLLFRLERKELVPLGTFDHYMYHYEHRRNEDFGPGSDYPLGITM
jgi:hypothetical protein